MKNMKIILNSILTNNSFEYILIDRGQHIVKLSDGVTKFFSIKPKLGNEIMKYMPELMGNEDKIKKIFSNKPSQFQLKRIYKNGFFLNISIEYFDQECILLLFTDVTSITRSEQKLLQHSNETLLLCAMLEKEKQEQNMLIEKQSKLASMGEMVNSIAHQWRQPLHRINSNMAVISQVLEDESLGKSKLQFNILNVLNNVEYMSNTIEDFINFFSPDKDKTKFNLTHAVENVLELIVSRLQDVRVEVISETPDATIFSYKHEYYQVILCILNNAIDNFINQNVDNPVITLRIRKEDTFSILYIEDNGGGISEKNIDIIFEPYFTTKVSTDGTGLGLYIAKQIIEQNMKGELSVYNTDNGACFEIKVPDIL